MAKKYSFIVFSIILMMVGVLLLLENFNYIPPIHIFWPLFLLMIGLGFVMLFEKNKDIGMIFLGSLLIQLSILFQYLNITSWKKLSFLWPIFILIIGISFLTLYKFNRSKIMLYISMASLLLAVTFILVFTISHLFWPISLIIIGIYLYLISKYQIK